MNSRARTKYSRQATYSLLQSSPPPKEKNWLGKFEDALPYWVPRVRINFYYNPSTLVLAAVGLTVLVAAFVGVF